MCGRAALAPSLGWAEYYRLMGFDIWANLRPNYNVTPTQNLACCRLEEGRRSAFVARWGLIPSWAKDTKIGASCSNARAENRGCGIAFEDVHYNWRWAWCGFGRGDYLHEEHFEFADLTVTGLFRVSISVRTIPCWSIVLPLTLLSACLILSKPRKWETQCVNTSAVSGGTSP